MITVPEATKNIVERSRYLSEALSKDLINLSSLARYIKPELEEMLVKKVSTPSVIMALKRVSKEIQPKYAKKSLFDEVPAMTIRSGLTLLRLNISAINDQAIKSLLSESKNFRSLTVTRTQIVVILPASSESTKLVTKLNESQFIEDIKTSIASISIQLPKTAENTPGIYYFFLKSLAWEGINISESVSTSKEYILFFDEKDIHHAFKTLSSLFVKGVF